MTYHCQYCSKEMFYRETYDIPHGSDVFVDYYCSPCHSFSRYHTVNSSGVSQNAENPICFGLDFKIKRQKYRYVVIYRDGTCQEAHLHVVGKGIVPILTLAQAPLWSPQNIVEKVRKLLPFL